MNTRRNLIKALSIIFSSTILLFSCGDDPEPMAPIISISETTFTGDIGDEVSVTIDGTLDGDFVNMAISKFVGTTPDATGNSTVTTGLPHTFTHTLGTEGILEPVRFNFLVTDDNDLTASVDLIITTDASRTQLLVSFDWQYTDLWFGDPLAPGFIAECEKDNVFSFEADGTMSLDFGSSGDGAGSCAGDGLLDWVSWEFDANEEVLSLSRVDVLADGSTVPKDVLVWTIIEFDQTAFLAEEESIFGPLRYDYAAVAK